MTLRPPGAWAPDRWLRVRIGIASALVAVLFGWLGYHAYQLQVQQSVKLRTMAEEQYLRDVELPAHRGRILDRSGVELAASVEIDSVAANPRVVSEQPDAATALAEALHMDRREVAERLHSTRFFTWLKRRIPADEARHVRALGLSGITLTKEPRRYYPNRGLAGLILGWAGLDSSGQEGLELSYDHWLRGARAAVPGLRDALGRDVLTSGIADATPQRGHDVVTTIDLYIQFRLEQALVAGVAAHHAKAGVAVALDPRNGEVLAMAAVPSVDPNDPEAGQKGARNRAVTDPFEPGSTMKTFSIAGALVAGVVRTTDHWFCENGRFQVGPAVIHDAERIGDATTVEVLAKSSNICTAKIAARQGRDRLHDMLLRFGFGRPTGIDLPGERAGQIRKAARMGPVETATMSFGQGLTATPLQLAAAYASLADNGIWHQPHVVARVLDAEGHVTWEPTPEAHRILDEEMAQTMRTMLLAVTQKGGTAEKLVVPGYSFAGKTGTAQKVDPVTRRYSTDKWASSFAGFAPAVHPRMALFVMVDEPQGTHYGSMVAGPIFAEVMRDALRSLNVPPDLAVASVSPPAVAKAVAGKRADALTANTDKDAPSSAPIDGSRASDPNDESDGEEATVEVPDFTGLSVSEALVAADHAGVRLEIVGSGLGVAQSPGPGPGQNGAPCRVQFSSPSS